MLWSAALKGLKDCFSLGKAAPWSGTLKGLKVCSSLGKVALKGLEVCSSLGKVVVWFGALKVLKVCCWVAVLGFCSLRRRPLYRRLCCWWVSRKGFVDICVIVSNGIIDKGDDMTAANWRIINYEAIVLIYTWTPRYLILLVNLSLRWLTLPCTNDTVE